MPALKADFFVLVDVTRTRELGLSQLMETEGSKVWPQVFWKHPNWLT